MGLLALGAGHAPEMYITGRKLPDEEHGDKRGIDMIEMSKTVPKGDIQGRRSLPDIWINIKGGR